MRKLTGDDKLDLLTIARGIGPVQPCMSAETRRFNLNDVVSLDDVLVSEDSDFDNILLGCRQARDLLKEGETGYLFRAEDTADLARAMGRMLSDPAHARAMGRNARELIKGYSTAASAKGIRDGLLSGA